MAVMSRRRASALLATAMATTMVLAGCSGSDEGVTAAVGSDEFPTSQFPENTYGGLSGELTLYDTSGGSVSEGRDATINKRFSELTGVAYRNDFNDGNAKFFAAAESGQVPWSVVELSSKGDVIRATEAGLLEQIDTSKVPVDLLEDGTSTDFALPEQQYGTVLIYNHDKWPESDKHPESIKDLYNTADFPGKRCLPKDPKVAGGVLESALLADGVPRDQLYPLDVERGLAKLDSIKNDVVWWNDGDSSVRFLTSGECDMGIVWSARAFAVISEGAPLTVTWKDSLVSNAFYAVPKDAPNKDAGMAFLAMQIQDIKGQVELVDRVPYPMPIKGIPLTDYSDEVRPFLPVGENFEVAIQQDGDYYANEGDTLQATFNAWLAES